MANLYIEQTGCVGDIEHNKYIDVLMKDILDSNISDIILKDLEDNYKTGNWIFERYSKEELRKINTIMRTKNPDMVIKRMQNFIAHLDKRTPIMKRLEIYKWKLMDKLTEEFAKNKLILH